MNQTVKKIFDQHRPLCLASSSPRRKDMLQNFGLEFFSISPDIDESRR
ncbi:MAG: Maf family protein, partial [SAR324 cluster bacterium]|nr:Maf family protein [SAR324 cluster bacterium]